MKRTDDYAEVISKTTAMVRDEAVQRLAQEPLKQKDPIRFGGMLGMTTDFCCTEAELSDVEEAVIGHGKVEGPFTEIEGLEIERDDRYPIRVTVQFYKATSNGVVSGQDMTDIAEQINKVYRQADYVGSLVVQGPTGRPTEYGGAHVEPPQWWDVFWQRHFQNTGQTREQAIEMLRTLFGERWQESTSAQSGPGGASSRRLRGGGALPLGAWAAGAESSPMRWASQPRHDVCFRWRSRSRTSERDFATVFCVRIFRTTRHTIPTRIPSCLSTGNGREAGG